MNRLFITILLFSICLISTNAQDTKPIFEEIYKREIPAWFNQDKFGIFVVWGPYSVPSFKTKGYAEWYWQDFTRRDKHSKEFHNRVYGKDFEY